MAGVELCDLQVDHNKNSFPVFLTQHVPMEPRHHAVTESKLVFIARLPAGSLWRGGEAPSQQPASPPAV